jgi:hypothetical protein
MVLIYQPPNVHVRISWILLRNVMATAAMKKIYIGIKTDKIKGKGVIFFVCKFPPNDMQIRSKFDGADPSFPMIPGS